MNIEVVEARNIQTADVYAEIKLDDWTLAITSTKPKTSTPIWGESFTFEYFFSFSSFFFLSSFLLFFQFLFYFILFYFILFYFILFYL